MDNSIYFQDINLITTVTLILSTICYHKLVCIVWIDVNNLVKNEYESERL